MLFVSKIHHAQTSLDNGIAELEQHLTAGRARTAAAAPAKISVGTVYLIDRDELAQVIAHEGEKSVRPAVSLFFLDDPAAVTEQMASRTSDALGTILLLPRGEFLSLGEAAAVVVSDKQSPVSREVACKIADLALRGAPVFTIGELLQPPGPGCAAPPMRRAVDFLLSSFEGSRSVRWEKRALDLGLSALGLLLVAPLILLISLAIKLDSSGPVFFLQERLGRRRAPFNCLKFRTMRQDAERETGPVWASASDPRITRIGRFLRKTRMDELPQLINVFRGEMSLVGPRPIRPYFADRLSEQVPFYNLRFVEKPGITGWAQVKHVYAASYAEQVDKFHYDYYYIRNQSFLLDLYIMALTFWVVIRMKGA